MNLRQRDLHNAATILVVAVACVILVPPLAVDGRMNNLELSLGLLTTTLVLAVFSSRPPKVLVLPALLFALLAFMALSSLWSVSSAQTVRDVVTFFALAMAAIILVHSSPLPTIITGVALSGAVILLWTVAVMILSPESAFNHVGALIGPYGNRNGLAYALLQSLPAALALTVRSRRGLAGKFLLSAALCVAIYATLSRTSLLVLIAVLFTGVAIVLMRKNRRWGWAFGAVALGAIVVAATNFATVLALLGKSASLNGRAQIWDTLLGVAAQSPLIGYGWSSSWPPEGFPSMKVASRLGGVVIYHAHNEMLNWIITTGLIGLLLVLLVYVFIFWRGTRMLQHDPSTGIWMLLAGVVLVARGISEISETQPQGWFILAVLTAVAAQSLALTPESKLGKVLVFTLPTAARQSAQSESGSVVA
ncbi:O-antigen ligase [Salinibacterium sp. M195]|uniref:O-antigen ligase family protein n=1 Tax=Salinibacterium sp. M195 TaxID=2583374 RepID=UPI001C63B40B|nr:O-antigen ligase family protein [Salinibacterium sp. M195]QYH34849.1 O-antigen ligase family protein [Salinibacterium sp. M195]